jgi:antitoxin CcdA
MRMMASRLRSSDTPTTPRRATNVSLPEALVAEAKDHGISVSRSCEAGLAAAVKKAREEKWMTENREALRSNHDWVEKNGIPLAQFRKF